MTESKSPMFNRDKSKAPTDERKEATATPVQPAEVRASVPVSIKVKYVGGQGIELAYPLSNGLRSFIGGKVYTLTNYGDFCRLTEASKHFVEVKDEPAR